MSRLRVLVWGQLSRGIRWKVPRKGERSNVKIEVVSSGTFESDFTPLVHWERGKTNISFNSQVYLTE